jgi:hypothetical protein
MKTIGGLRKLRHRGGELVDWILTFTGAAYNLIRLRTLLARRSGRGAPTGASIPPTSPDTDLGGTSMVMTPRVKRLSLTSFSSAC